MEERHSDPGRPEAWGDVVPPTEAEQRVEPDSNVRQATQAYAFSATTSQLSTDIHYDMLPLGPGNEAMEGGLSPAPRGYTGGAMGKFVAGLSPSFTDAAMGIPAPAGNQLYTPAEAVTTFSAMSGIGAPSAAQG